MPQSSIFIHLIWSTKNRFPFITKDLKHQLLAFLKQYNIDNSIKIEAINCAKDHIHILISLGTGQMVTKLVRLLKGASSFWISKKTYQRKNLNGKIVILPYQ